MLHNRVNDISTKPKLFTEAIWTYLENVLVSVLMRHSKNYHQLHLSLRNAANSLISHLKDRSQKWVMEVVDVEKLTDYTCNPDYLLKWNELMAHQRSFMQKVLHDNPMASSVLVQGYGEVVEVEHLRRHPHALEQAFDLRMRVAAYWKVVVRRIVDSMALQYSIVNLIGTEMEMEMEMEMELEIVNQVMDPRGVGIEKMLEESPYLAAKREKLNRSILKLRQSKEVMGNIIDRIAITNV